MTVLQDEGQDRRAELRIVTELLQVAAVLSFRPHGHLDETHQSEKRHRETLSHQCEAQPRAQLFYTHIQRNVLTDHMNISHTKYNQTHFHLIGVVGAGDEQEDPGEGVFSRVWDLSRLRSCGRETYSLNNRKNRNACNIRWAQNYLVAGDFSRRYGWRSFRSDKTDHNKIISPEFCETLNNTNSE